MTETPPTLGSIKEWPEWKNWVEQTARRDGLWEYMDPAILEGDLQYLDPPKEPWTRAVWQTRELVYLNDEEFKEMIPKLSAYRTEQLTYERKRDAMDRLQRAIEDSVSTECQEDLFGEDVLSASYEVIVGRRLRALSEAFERPTREQVRELETEWLQIQALVDQPMLRYYLRRLDDLLKKCARFHMVKRSSNLSRDRILVQALMEEGQGTLPGQPWFVMPELSGSESKDSEDVESEGSPESDSKKSVVWGAEMSDEAASKDDEEAVHDEEMESEGTEEAESEEDTPVDGWEYCGPWPKATTGSW